MPRVLTLFYLETLSSITFTIRFEQYLNLYNLSGIKSEKCIQLAHMHSDAVDFPKTGECPSLTPELRPEQYPDFMMKSDKPRYK